MDKNKLQKFFELLHEIVNAHASVSEKKASLLSEAGEGDKTNLAEFQSWFDEEDFD